MGMPGMDAEEPEFPYLIPGPMGQSAAITLLRTTANQTINGGAATFVDITNLTFPVVNGLSYAFYFYIVWQSAAVNTGLKLSVNCPAGTLDHFTTFQNQANSAAGTAAYTHKHNTVVDDMTLQTSVISAAVDLLCMIQGRYVCTANGTFAARCANELNANTDITIRTGSWGIYF
jgi:hypothetical protein